MDGEEFEPSVWDTAYTAQPFAAAGGAVVSATFEESVPAAVLASASAPPEPFEKKSEQVLLVKISAPEKHGDGLDAYITYQISTQTSLATYTNPKCTVRRRYQDFLWLRLQLTKEHPAVVLPPLPEKNRLEYLDRFSPEFLQRRQAALQRFLDRVCTHPILHKSDVLRTFLEAKAASFETAKQLKKGAMFEDLGDSLINTFAKLKRPNDRFVAVAEYLTKLEESLYGLERLHLRIVKRQTDMATELADVGSSFTLLSGSEELTGEALQAIGASTDKRVQILKQMNENLQLDFIERIRDYLLYCQSIRTVLRARDQRQMEYEDLSDLLTQQLAERDKLVMGTGSGGMLSWPLGVGGGGSSSGASGVSTKNDEQAKQERIDKINAKIKELEETVKDCGDALKAFNILVMQELDMFNRAKTDDFKLILRDYARIHAEFYNKSAQDWESVVPTIDAIADAPIDK